MDFDKLRTLPGITQEEFDQIHKDILTLAGYEVSPLTGELIRFVEDREEERKPNQPTPVKEVYMSENYWQIDEAESEDHCLELKDPEGWRSATVKWDGCIHYNRYYNTPMGMDKKNDEEADYLHICDIDEEIARLQALKRIAANWFNRKGPSEYWHVETVDADKEVGRKEYTDEPTGIKLIVERDNPEYPSIPKLTIVCAKGVPLVTVNEAMSRLQEMANIQLQHRMPPVYYALPEEI